MKNVCELYGEARDKRKEERLKLELKYKENLLFLQNEEIDEWMDICKKVHDGELLYDLHLSTVNLGKAVRQRDTMLEEIKELKVELGLEEEEYI